MRPSSQRFVIAYTGQIDAGEVTMDPVRDELPECHVDFEDWNFQLLEKLVHPEMVYMPLDV